MEQKIIHFLTDRKEFNSLNAKVATRKLIDWFLYNGNFGV